MATEVMATEVMATEVMATEVMATEVMATEVMATELVTYHVHQWSSVQRVLPPDSAFVSAFGTPLLSSLCPARLGSGNPLLP